MNSILQIRLAKTEDAASIENLRVSAYENSPDFKATAQFLRYVEWGDDDERNPVLTIWDSCALLATMRMETIASREEGPRYFNGIEVPEIHCDWPSPVLSKAATHPDFRNTGLNSILRLCFLRAASAAGARRLYGHVAMDGARTRLMRDLGYDFSPRGNDDPLLPSRLKWCVAWLDLEAKGKAAAEALERLVASELATSSWVGPKLEYNRFWPRRPSNLAILDR